MTPCPSAFQLEAYFVGESSQDFAEHIESCEACMAYIQVLGAERSALLAERPATDFLNEPALVHAFADAETKSLWRRLFTLPIAVPLLVTAAALVLWLRAPGDLLDGQNTGSGSTAAVSPVSIANDTILMKGQGFRLTVQRKRADQIMPFETKVSVQKGDRLSVSLDLAQAATLTVALQDLTSGRWIILARHANYPAGRSVVASQSSQDITDNQTRGRIIVGPPTDIDAVIKGKKASQSIRELSIIPEAQQ